MDSETLSLGDVRAFAATVLRRWWVFVITIGVPVAIVILLGMREPPMYRSEATVLVRGSQAPIVPSVGEIEASRELAKYYQDLLTTTSVLDRVVDRLDLPYSASSLRSRIHVSAVRSLLIVRATDADPERAAAIVNVAADVFVEDVRDRQLRELADFQQSLDDYGLSTDPALLSGKIGEVSMLSVIEPGIAPSSPISRGYTGRVALGVLLGLALGFAVVVVLHYWRENVGTADRLQTISGITTLASVPKFAPPMELSDAAKGEIGPRSPYWEPYRFLRAYLQFTSGREDGMGVYLVTSALPTEGKTTTSLCLAIAMAQEGRRTLLVDADLRAPSLHDAWDVPNEVGLTSFLCNEASLEDIVEASEDIEGLSFITSGPLPIDASPLLHSPRLVELINTVREGYDVAVFDSSPVLSVADASLLSAKVDGSVLVVDSATPERAVRGAVRSLRQAGGPLVGTVLNKVHRDGQGYGYYSYSRGYHSYSYGEQSRQRRDGRGPLGRFSERLERARRLAGRFPGGLEPVRRLAAPLSKLLRR